MLKSHVKDILANRLEYHENNVKITGGQLERSVYEDVNVVLTRLKGKWKGGKTQAHVFPFDPKPLIQSVVETNQLPPDNPYALFPTPAHVIMEVLDYADLDWRSHFEPDYNPSEYRVLEPSAGIGGFADVIAAKLHANDTLHCVEIDPYLAGILRSKCHTVFEQDFTTYVPDKPYDLIVMNPPFSVDGDALAYMTHIHHAWSMLKDNGELIAIVPPGWVYNQNKRCKVFREFVSKYGVSWYELPAGTFKESGTTIATQVLYLHKKEPDTKRAFWLATLYFYEVEEMQRARTVSKDELKEWIETTFWKRVFEAGDFLYTPDIDIDRFYDWIHE